MKIFNLYNLIKIYVLIVVLFGIHYFTLPDTTMKSYFLLKHASLIPFYICAMIIETAKILFQQFQNLTIIIIQTLYDTLDCISNLLSQLFHVIVMPWLTTICKVFITLYTYVYDFLQIILTSLWDHIIIPFYNQLQYLILGLYNVSHKLSKLIYDLIIYPFIDLLFNLINLLYRVVVNVCYQIFDTLILPIIPIMREYIIYFWTSVCNVFMWLWSTLCYIITFVVDSFNTILKLIINLFIDYLITPIYNLITWIIIQVMENFITPVCDFIKFIFKIIINHLIVPLFIVLNNKIVEIYKGFIYLITMFRTVIENIILILWDSFICLWIFLKPFLVSFFEWFIILCESILEAMNLFIINVYRPFLNKMYNILSVICQWLILILNSLWNLFLGFCYAIQCYVFDPIMNFMYSFCMLVWSFITIVYNIVTYSVYTLIMMIWSIITSIYNYISNYFYKIWITVYMMMYDLVSGVSKIISDTMILLCDTITIIWSNFWINVWNNIHQIIKFFNIME